MDQDDFRQMLSTSAKSYGGKRNLTEADLAEIKKLAKKPKEKSKKVKNIATEEPEQHKPQPIKSLYRDRAAERRKGGVEDVVDAQQNAHQVIGLDYALLAQLKKKQKLLTATEQERQRHLESAQEETKAEHNKLTFKSRMGRLVYFHACQSTSETAVRQRMQKSELFLPGRMYYTFNLSRDEVESIPVSVQRSKEDCPASDEVVSGVLDEALIDRVKELMTSKKIGKKLRKKRKTESHDDGEEKEEQVKLVEEVAVASAAPSADVEMTVDDEDEDIFPDVGEYVPIDQRVDNESADAAKKDAVKKAGYFSNLSAAITEKEETERRKEEDAEHAWKDALQRAVDKQKRLEEKQARKAKEAKMIAAADDYAEYQGDAAFDSDGEDDEETRRRRKAAGLSDRSADPEVDKEEKARRKKQKQSSKMANDLEKINKLMEDKAST